VEQAFDLPLHRLNVAKVLQKLLRGLAALSFELLGVEQVHQQKRKLVLWRLLCQ
jgi:hypothetical protein